jgi:hypothetical protein
MRSPDEGNPLNAVATSAAPGLGPVLRRLYLLRFGFALVWAVLLFLTASDLGPVSYGPAAGTPAPTRVDRETPTLQGIQLVHGTNVMRVVEKD